MRVPIALLPYGDGAGLTHGQALQSPCLTCSDTPCCSYLPVHTFTVHTLADVDYAGYLLNFTGIELAINAEGQWSTYFRQSCRHLSPTDGSCTLHGSPAQPIVCQQYNPYQCWYKRVMTVSASDELVRIDRRRLDWILEHTRYDEHRRIVSSPSWHNLVAACAELPLDVTPVPHPSPVTDPGPPAPSGRRSLPVISTGPRRYADITAASPCDGCAAFCCTKVEFPLAVPRSVASLDFVKFSLGFPGVSIGVTDEGWRLIISTTCRHLVGGRCSVYGTPQRPLKCAYYDAWRCTFRRDHDVARTDAIVTVALEQYDWLLETVSIDDDGVVTAMVDAATLSGHLRSRAFDAAPATARAAELSAVR